MKIEARLCIIDGELHALIAREADSVHVKPAKPYLQMWQETNGIENGSAIVLCPHDQAQAVEDFLAELRAQGRNTPLQTEA